MSDFVFDKQQIFHSVAQAYAKSELEQELKKGNTMEMKTSPQEKLDFLVAEYCQALGYCQGFNEDYLLSLIQKELP